MAKPSVVLKRVPANEIGCAQDPLHGAKVFVPIPESEPKPDCLLSELPLFLGVPEPPERADAAFCADFPALVEGREVEHGDVLFLRPALGVDEVLEGVVVAGFGGTEGFTRAGPAGFGDDDGLGAGCLFGLVVHLLHVQQGIVDVAALPIRVAIREDDVAGLGDQRAIREFVVRVHVTDRDVGQSGLDAFDVGDEFVLLEFFAVHHFVAYGRDVHEAGARELDQGGDLFLVLLKVIAEPSTYERLEAVLAGEPGDDFVAFGAREYADPLGVRGEEGEFAPDLFLGDGVAGFLLALVGAEADAVHFSVEVQGALFLQCAAV